SLCDSGDASEESSDGAAARSVAFLIAATVCSICYNASILMHFCKDLFGFAFKVSGRDRAIHPALFRCSFFPPPASRTRIFVILYGPGAGSTTDTGVSFCIKRVFRNIVISDIINHLLLRPICKWV